MFVLTPRERLELADRTIDSAVTVEGAEFMPLSEHNFVSGASLRIPGNSAPIAFIALTYLFPDAGFENNQIRGSVFREERAAVSVALCLWINRHVAE